MFKKAKDAAKGLTGILDFSEGTEEKTAYENRDENLSLDERLARFNKGAETSDTLVKDMPVRTERAGESDSVTNRNSRLRIYKPTHYDVVQNIGRDIRDGIIVLLDMSSLDEKTTVKILQFVYGICFALDIEPEDVSPKIISIDPQNKTHR